MTTVDSTVLRADQTIWTADGYVAFDWTRRPRSIRISIGLG